MRAVAARENRSTQRANYQTAKQFDHSQVAESEKGLSKDLQDVVLRKSNDKKSVRQSLA